jgi:hypothetical protein
MSLCGCIGDSRTSEGINNDDEAAVEVMDEASQQPNDSVLLANDSKFRDTPVQALNSLKFAHFGATPLKDISNISLMFPCLVS